jgi:hypothetical protein
MPGLSNVTPEVVSYWEKRARASTHPVMRARYADLLWELGTGIDWLDRSGDMARIAVDSYVDAVDARMYDHESTLIAKAKRALDLSMLINDSARVARAQQAVIATEDALAEDELLGLWGHSFDLFVAQPSVRWVVPEETKQKLIDDMERRLKRLSDQQGGEYHPTAAESAALRLARLYRRLGAREDVRRVMDAYSATVLRMKDRAAPLLLTHSLERLHEQLRTFEMKMEADALHADIRIASDRAKESLHPITVETKIDAPEIDAFFAGLLQGDAASCLKRIAVHFTPLKKDVEKQITELSSVAPISYLVNHTILGEDGRTVAVVGPLSEDLDGHLLRQMCQNVQLSAWFLREAFQRTVSGQGLTDRRMLDYLFDSPLYALSRRD